MLHCKKSKNHQVRSESNDPSSTKVTYLPNAIISISKLLIIKAKLIHKVRSHLLDLIV